MRGDLAVRTRGSCRFEPYWKVQAWDAPSLAWKDVQKAHPSPEAARSAAPRGVRVRLVEVSESGRSFGEPEILA